MPRYQRFNSSEFHSTKPTAFLKPDRIQPHFSDIVFTLYVHMR